MFVHFHNITMVCRYCGVKDPSWSEIGHFVKFLDLQLQSCERSHFTNEKFVGDVLSGFKSFVIKFMIQMSRVSIFDMCDTLLHTTLTLLGLLHIITAR